MYYGYGCVRAIGKDTGVPAGVDVNFFMRWYTGIQVFYHYRFEYAMGIRVLTVLLESYDRVPCLSARVLII